MRVTRVRVQNIRSFEDSRWLDLGSITLFVGPNNSGKSTLLRGLGLMQTQEPPLGQSFRRTEDAHILLDVDLFSPDVRHWPGQPMIHSQIVRLHVDYYPEVYNISLIAPDGGVEQRVNQIPNMEPHNYIYPYLAKRKVMDLSETVNLGLTTAVSGDLRNLVAKVDRLSNPQHPSYELYTRMCSEVLGFVVTTFASSNGKRAGIVTGKFTTIGIDQMGEGVASLVGLIVDLCVADNQLFLIEELENDVHPQALKSLLNLVVEQSASNQFVISTHSNIVSRYLGSASDSIIYRISMNRVDGVPLSAVERVGNNAEERTALLAELGYELRDFDLWNGWLFLEESSAERIIRDHLIRWFAPSLSSVRTLAVGGVSKAAPTFEDFNRLFRFTHLESLYRQRAWVVLDGDEVGVEAISRLKATYSTWPADHFRSWSRSEFEHYYPRRFATATSSALFEPNREIRRAAKKRLLESVLEWIAEDDATARSEFESSAAEIIDLLREIERSLDLR